VKHRVGIGLARAAAAALVIASALSPAIAALAQDTPEPAAAEGTPEIVQATPDATPESSVVQGSPTPGATGTPTAALTAKPYRAKSPEYGMNVFLWDNPATTGRDLNKLREANFTWQKTLFQWREIEPAKGQYRWTEADRVIRASKDAGIKVIGRLDFQPVWARADRAHNGPPDNYADFGEFVYALVSRYRAGSEIGQLHAIQVWNEPNLGREWANQPIGPAHMRLLKVAYEAAKKADPSIVVISGGLSPTGWNDDTARPDDAYLQWLYAAGAKPYFDVLGAHGPGFKAPPSVSPDEAATNPLYGGHRSFTFRRVEDLRKIMVDNGDADKQIWLLEFGWTTDEVNSAYAWHRVTPEQHAQYIVDAYRWAHQNWSPWIGVMALWTLPDPRWEPTREELWWAVANADGTDRPAMRRLAEARRNGELP
jgi:polysaccharide biosynthesis protein PslG